MIWRRGLCIASLGLLLTSGATDSTSTVRERLWHHRNLGKAYYENPMTQLKAVEEFRQALELSPQSARDQINYGLALLRAGMTKEAVAQLQKAQKADPSIPHTWFNLGMAYKKDFDNQHAIEQLEGMLKLVRDEPVLHYNLGVLYKLTGKPDQALEFFKAAAQLNPNFAAPHFQLYNTFREAGQKDDAARELATFNEIKKRKTGAAVAEDPEWCRFAEIYDSVELDSAYEGGAASPPVRFQSAKVARVDAGSAGMIALDVNGDGHPDLLVWSNQGVIVLDKGVTAMSGTGLESLKDVVSIAAGDFNNDGLPDLAVLTRSGASIYVNHAGHFERLAVNLPPGEYTRAVWFDYDHDYDLDLLLLGRKPALMRNDGSAGFSDQTIHFPFAAGKAVDAAGFELIPDTNTADLAVLYDDGSIIVYRDRMQGVYEAIPLDLKVPGGSTIQAFDINNDGWSDLAVSSAAGLRILMNDRGKIAPGVDLNAGGPFVFADVVNRGFSEVIASGAMFRNLGKGKFEKARTESLPAAVSMAQADFDGGGKTDVAAITTEGSVVLLKADVAERNTYIEVQLEGVKNLKVPLGAAVEVKVGPWYQKKTYAGVPLLFGLRANAEVDTVRITWPNGLVQNEIKQSAGRAFSYKEKARLSGSCPLVFAWNGSVFGFVTDVLGVAPLGASDGNGTYFPVNHRERIVIPGEALQAHDGSYEVRITEELREVTYLDRVQMIAVDHEAGSALVLSDRFKAPPFPQSRLYEVHKKTYPVSARDDAGGDVLDRVTHLDGRYADTFRRNDAGVGELHSLTLDFGQAAADNRALLVLNGWVDWPDGSTFLASSQERQGGLVFPYLQVRDATGNWRTVDADMGMPSGKPKTIAVDMTGKFLSRSREVRIVTSLCLYWDEIFLADHAEAHRARLTELRTDSADLHYRGFSTVVVPAGHKGPEQFEYEKWTPVSMWNPTPGLYTKYGDVRSLLLRADDKMVILGSGDELRLLFRGNLPRLAPGKRRDFILMVEGWAKDSDANTAFARSVGPLPFHQMKMYPYQAPQHFPDDPGHLQYQRKFNTRVAIQDLKSLLTE